MCIGDCLHLLLYVFICVFVTVQHEREYEVQAEVPGVRKEDIKVDVERNMLHLTVERSMSDNSEGGGGDEGDGPRYHRSERRFGRVERRFRLPDNADGDHVEGKCENGILRLKIPKKESAERRSVTIQ